VKTVGTTASMGNLELRLALSQDKPCRREPL